MCMAFTHHVTDYKDFKGFTVCLTTPLTRGNIAFQFLISIIRHQHEAVSDMKYRMTTAYLYISWHTSPCAIIAAKADRLKPVV